MRSLTLLLALLALSFASPARADVPLRCSQDGEGRNLNRDDTDGDDVPDYAVALPGAGAAIVYQSAGAAAAVKPPAGEAGFGASAALGDVDDDGCADLVVGAPGANAVLIYPGRQIAGVGTIPPTVLHGADGDDFGAAVAVAGSDPTRLWVGAPGRKGGRGAVDLFQTDGNGVSKRTGSFTSFRPAAKQRYGSVLSPAILNGAYVGVPRRTVTGHRNAGVVERISATAAGKPRKARVYALPKPRRNDRFGTSVATHLFGAPGRNRSAGSVARPQGRKLVEITQDSKGVPGRAARGHRFGTAVATAFGLLCGEDDTGVVSAPGDGSGSVTFVPGYENCSAGRRLVGPVTAVGVRHDSQEYEEDATDQALVGIPGAFQRLSATKVLETRDLAGASEVVFAIPYG